MHSQSRKSTGAAVGWLLSGACLLIATACSSPSVGRLQTRAISSPAPASSLVPQVLALENGRIAASWLEPMKAEGYRFRMAILESDTWSEPRSIAEGPDLVMFSADLPGLQAMPDGQIAAYWQRKDSSTADPFATKIQLARTADDGRTWTQAVIPHRDDVSGAHSFVASFTEPGGVGMVWLDALKQRFVPSGGSHEHHWMGAMGLRYAAFDTAGQLRRDEFVDSIVCDCCPNAAAVTASGPVIAYRDRMAREGMRPEDLGAETATARDVHVRRLENGIWGKAVRVHADNWITNACPVNGPALDASGHQLVVAWWTAADDQPRVQLAFSEDAGDRFGAPIRIDQGAADGQVTVALMADSRGAVVGWQERGHAWARLVSADGRATAPVSLGESPRRSRLPRWVARGHGVIAGWTREERGRLSAVFTEILVQ